MLVVCDIDGVLADVKEYVWKYLPGNWREYFAHTTEFPIIKPLQVILRQLAFPVATVYFMTGRPESNRTATLEWLRSVLGGMGYCDLDPYLWMRQDGDYRPTSVIKFEWICNMSNVPDLVIEDDPAVVRVLKNLGPLIVQVHGTRASRTDYIPKNYI